jgi:Carbohydrate binding domain/Secretion system C-terminal sorting domain/Immunoglobulin I-set domain
VTNSGGNITSSAAMLKVTTGSVSILSNWSFDAGTTSWTFFTNGTGGISVVNGGTGNITAAKLAITTGGSNIQLYQAPVTLEEGAKYVLFFRAYCSTGHDLSVSVQKHGSPYTSYGLSSQLVDLTTGWKDFSIQFTAGGFTGVATDGRLMFWIAPFAADGDEYYLDDVVLAKVSSVAPPAVTTQPLSRSVNLSQTATFNIAVSGTPPSTYQWKKTGVDIPGANSPSYTTPPVVTGDNGSTYLCAVSNPVGNVSSNSATLTVVTTDVREVGGVPTAYTLDQNYPNPFNPATEIRYAVPREGHVVLEVYSIVGELVATLVNQTQPAGYYTVRFDAQRLPSGIYLYRLKADGASIIKKMALTK